MGYIVKIFVPRKPPENLVNFVRLIFHDAGYESRINYRVAYKQEELDNRIPKVHFQTGPREWVCATQNVPHRRLTKDITKVTCLLCLAIQNDYKKNNEHEK